MQENTGSTNMMRRCPICDSQNVRIKYSVRQYKIYTCRECRGAFTFPRPEDVEVRDIYDDEYLETYKQTPSHGPDYSDWRFDCLSKMGENSAAFEESPNIRSVFDIGCGTGYFLSRFKQDGWDTYGMEVLPQSGEYARNEFGLDVTVGDFLGVDIAPDSFDLVTMIHVIEHFIDPNRAVQKTRDILKPGGLFFLETPNWDGIGAIVQKERWSHLIPPEHLNYFGPSSMRVLAERNGFQILSMKTVTPPYLVSIQRFPILLKRILRLAYSFSSFLNRGPTLQVLLKRE